LKLRQFEIDDNGQPYCDSAKNNKNNRIVGGTDVNGAVIVNAVKAKANIMKKMIFLCG
jgi:hypothetical protein